MRYHLAQWVCRTWNGVHKDTPYELQYVEIITYLYDLQSKQEPPWTEDDVSSESLFTHDCFSFRDDFSDLVDGEDFEFCFSLLL